jgi:hypothetical protein
MAVLTGPVLATPAVDSTTRHDEAKIAVGSKAFSQDGEFVYVQAGAAFPASGTVGPVSVATTLSAVVTGDLDTGAFLGIADAAFASGEFGFIRTKGPATVVVESGAVAGNLLQLSATAGKLKVITTSGQGVAIALEAADDAGLAAKNVYIL